MPRVTLERVFPATYIQAPTSALTSGQDRLGDTGTLCMLDARYGGVEGRTRQICVFLGERATILTSPGHASLEGDVLTHIYRTTPTEGILREPQRDDLPGEYVNAWRLTGPEVRDPQARADLLGTIRTRFRVLRQAEMGEGI